MELAAFSCAGVVEVSLLVEVVLVWFDVVEFVCVGVVIVAVVVLVVGLNALVWFDVEFV
jgi:hypothetical protein